MTQLENIIPLTRQNSDVTPSFSDTVFGFLDQNYPLSENSSEDMFESKDWEGEEDDETCLDFEDRKAFWDDQEKLLNGILCRTSSAESKVRNATKEGLKKLIGNVDCECRRDVSDGCPDCLRQGMYNHLCNAGFVCLLQKSKWKTSHDIPSGEHTYLEVKEESSRNKEEVRVIIELNLRAEFEMAKASQEYNKLIKKLPQVYVGKAERLRNIIKILCGAAKMCMKDKKMHLAPWRKHNYMQAKWLNTCNDFNFTKTTEKPSSETSYPDTRLVKSRASLLTRSLIKGLSRTHCQTVEVI
ncbi:hypothetical protein KSS87_006461 [Heliosperma pusillum]|nr:hypothetical protein KSS87_006461 [Heliosperma pusillum]